MKSVDAAAEKLADYVKVAHSWPWHLSQRSWSSAEASR